MGIPGKQKSEAYKLKLTPVQQIFYLKLHDEFCKVFSS